jgi:hypothetical protein
MFFENSSQRISKICTIWWECRSDEAKAALNQQMIIQFSTVGYVE